MRKPTPATNTDIDSDPVLKEPTPATNPPTLSETQENWLTIKVSKHDNEVTFEQDKRRYSIELDRLPDTHDHPNWQKIATTLFQYQDIQQANASKKPIRLRIMTDNQSLALLHWHCLPNPETGKHLMHNGWVIEVGPIQHAHSNFHPMVISNPLVIIPIDKKHNIMGDQHFAQIQAYLESHFKITGTATRLSTPEQLQRELKIEKPDLIHLYAKTEGRKILLDTGNNGEYHISLEQLGRLLEEAEIKPIIIISLISTQEIDEYPKILINNSCLLWILATTHSSKICKIEQQLFNVLEKLPSNGDITDLIKKENNHHERRIQSIVWNSYQPPQLTISQSEQRKKQQFRVAILRIVLGREGLKDQISGGVGRNIKTTNMLVYAVSGAKSACPFDVPSQVQNQLQYVDSNKVPVISYYFNIHIAPRAKSIDMDNSIDDAIEHGIKNTLPTAEVIQQEIIRRAYNNQECCIAFNWFFDVPEDMQDKLSDWIKLWLNTICKEFDTVIPQKAMILHALCLQHQTHEVAKNTYQAVNQALSIGKRKDCNIKFLKFTNALGRLESMEITNFFETNTYWQKRLNLNKHINDYSHFADWIHTKTNGDFNAVIHQIWLEYQSNYRHYRNDCRTTARAIERV
ncbi:MAG: hypothetical protein KAH22_09115 [Thiotrichaceae bacterium]|nr:hypothetical protein [Thiotrichaceae bacterium]